MVGVACARSGCLPPYHLAFGKVTVCVAVDGRYGVPVVRISPAARFHPPTAQPAATRATVLGTVTLNVGSSSAR